MFLGLFWKLMVISSCEILVKMNVYPANIMVFKVFSILLRSSGTQYSVVLEFRSLLHFGVTNENCLT